MWELFLFGIGCVAGGSAVADWLGFKLAKHGDPFWIGWVEFRTFGLWKSEK